MSRSHQVIDASLASAVKIKGHVDTLRLIEAQMEDAEGFSGLGFKVMYKEYLGIVEGKLTQDPDFAASSEGMMLALWIIKSKGVISNAKEKKALDEKCYAWVNKDLVSRLEEYKKISLNCILTQGEKQAQLNIKEIEKLSGEERYALQKIVANGKPKQEKKGASKDNTSKIIERSMAEIAELANRYQAFQLKTVGDKGYEKSYEDRDKIYKDIINKIKKNLDPIFAKSPSGQMLLLHIGARKRLGLKGALLKLTWKGKKSKYDVHAENIKNLISLCVEIERLEAEKTKKEEEPTQIHFLVSLFKELDSLKVTLVHRISDYQDKYIGHENSDGNKGHSYINGIVEAKLGKDQKALQSTVWDVLILLERDAAKKALEYHARNLGKLFLDPEFAFNLSGLYWKDGKTITEQLKKILAAETNYQYALQLIIEVHNRLLSPIKVYGLDYKIHIKAKINDFDSANYADIKELSVIPQKYRDQRPESDSATESKKVDFNPLGSEALKKIGKSLESAPMAGRSIDDQVVHKMAGQLIKLVYRADPKPPSREELFIAVTIVKDYCRGVKISSSLAKFLGINRDMRAEINKLYTQLANQLFLPSLTEALKENPRIVEKQLKAMLQDRDLRAFATEQLQMIDREYHALIKINQGARQAVERKDAGLTRFGGAK